MFIIFIWLNFQSFFVGALTTISLYHYFNEDDELAPNNDETAGRVERREAEDWLVHRGFNRQYKERDQNQSAMKVILYMDWLTTTLVDNLCGDTTS